MRRGEAVTPAQISRQVKVLRAFIVEVIAGIPDEQRRKPVAVLCTDTRVEIPAIVEMVEGTLARIQKFSQQNNLNLEANLLKPPPEQSFWVNILGRGYRLDGS
jgi:DNA sulfur modification protein DndC